MARRVSAPFSLTTGVPVCSWLEGEKRMPDITVERRIALRYPMVLAVDVIDLPRGAKQSARVSDISRTGCYVDTLNPIARGGRVRIRFTHHQEDFEAVGSVVYVSQGLGMGVQFMEVSQEEQARLDRWLEEPRREF
jgi:hypothetical protein